MDLDRAKVVVQVADSITNTAKVEVEMMKVTGGTGSGFIPDTRAQISGPRAAPPMTALPGANMRGGK